MKLYDKDVYIISPKVLEGLLRQPPINPEFLLEGIKSQSIKGSIVLTIEELKEMWAMAKSGPDFPGVFELFLKSKGLTIKQ